MSASFSSEIVAQTPSTSGNIARSIRRSERILTGTAEHPGHLDEFDWNFGGIHLDRKVGMIDSEIKDGDDVRGGGGGE